MSGGPRFPRQPLAGRERAFVGPDGKNPFADGQASPPLVSTSDPSNVFAASQPSTFPADRLLYEAILPHRGRQILWLGIIGLGGALLGILVLGPILWFVAFGLSELSLVVVTGAMLVSFIAVYIGRTDLKAIRAGAMDPAGERSTVMGKRLGALGLVLGAIAWSFLLYSIVAAFFRAQ